MNITKNKYKELQRLKAEAEVAQKQLDEILERAEFITNDNHGECTFDFILNDFGTLDELLERLNITVR